MTDGVRLAGFSPAIVHIVDSDHGMRAQIAMSVVQSGGHAEIYEDIDELIGAGPSSGAVLMREPTDGAASIAATLHAGDVFLPVIVFAEDPKPSRIVRAVHDGVADFLAWPFSGEELIDSCEYCRAHMESNRGMLLRRQRARRRIAKLSDREKQILCFMLDGHSNKSMGQALDLSPRTVEDYRLNAMRKLGVNSTSAAIRIGLEAGLDEESEPACSPTMRLAIS